MLTLLSIQDWLVSSPYSIQHVMGNLEVKVVLTPKPCVLGSKYLYSSLVVSYKTFQVKFELPLVC